MVKSISTTSHPLQTKTNSNPDFLQQNGILVDVHIFEQCYGSTFISYYWYLSLWRRHPLILCMILVHQSMTLKILIFLAIRLCLVHSPKPPSNVLYLSFAKPYLITYIPKSPKNCLQVICFPLASPRKISDISPFSLFHVPHISAS